MQRILNQKIDKVIQISICHDNDYSEERVVGACEVADNFHTEMERISDGELEAWRIEWVNRFDHPMVKK